MNGHKSYMLSCFLYFCSRYESRLNSLGISLKPDPYPLPPDFDYFDLPEELSNKRANAILPYLLNDAKFYQARIYALTSLPAPLQDSSLGRVLWEMVGLDPKELIVLCNSIRDPDSAFPALYGHNLEAWPSSFGQDSGQRGDHDSMQGLESFLQGWPQDSRDQTHAVISYHFIPKLKIALREHMMGEYLWTHYRLEYLIRVNIDRIWNVGLSRLPEQHFPLEYGLLFFIRRCWSKLASLYIKRILPLLPDLPNSDTNQVEVPLLSSISTDISFDADDQKEVPRAVHVLFSAAGTGKTREIFQLLCQKWGFYILPPNLAPPITLTEPGADWESDMLDPQRIFGSKDTYSFFKDCPTIPMGWEHMPVNLFEHILLARSAIFREFLSQCPDPTPMKWLLMQISCAEMDPFDALSRLFRLAQSDLLAFGRTEYDHDYELQGSSMIASVQFCVEALKETGTPRFVDGDHVYFCFDEAQTVLVNEQTSRMMDHMYQAVLSLYSHTRCENGHYTEACSPDASDEDMDSPASGSESFEPGYSVVDPILIFSGTALDIDKMKTAIELALNRIFPDVDTPPPKKWKEYRVHNSFPLVTNDDSFWHLYKEHITQVMSEQVATQRQGQASRSTRPFLSRSGRPLKLREINSHGQDPEEYLKSETWLWRPLEIRPLMETVHLICQINFLSQFKTADVAPENDVPYALEAVLDQQDILRVTADMRFAARQLCSAPSDDVSQVRSAVLDMLAEYGGMSADAVARLIEATSTASFDGGNLPTLSSLLSDQLRNIYIRQFIVNKRRILRGRYRWSTAYIEAILTEATNLESGVLTPLRTIREIVENAEQNVSTFAIRCLQRQIDRMKVQGKSGLVQDLQRAGIRAEIMGRPTIFLDPKYAELVTYGFALVENYGRSKVKFQLAEPLAVRAIMDYLRGEHVQEYHQLMLQWLIHTQDDEVQAMFGKAAEWYIAAVSGEAKPLANTSS